MSSTPILTLEQAEKIKNDYGAFLEMSHGSLMEIFFAQIPETLLPYPKVVIEQAMISCEKYFAENGETETAKKCATARTALMFYSRAEDALKDLKKLLSNPEQRSVVLKNLGKSQLRSLDYALGNF